MDERGQQPALTDEAVDRAIAELLDVEPAPDFVARVRTRIEREALRQSWLGGWFAAATVAACLLAVIVTWTNWPGRTSAPVPQPSIAQARPAPARASDERQLQAPIVAASPTESASVPVLISPAEAEGVRYLLSALRDGRVDPTVLPVSGDEFELEPSMPLVIEPITVEPLVSAADLDSGVLQ